MPLQKLSTLNRLHTGLILYGETQTGNILICKDKHPSDLFARIVKAHISSDRRWNQHQI